MNVVKYYPMDYTKHVIENTGYKWNDSHLTMTAEDLKKWRHINGYSQSQLAAILGVIIITVSRWERGEREIPSYLHLALKCIRKRGGQIKRGRPPIRKNRTK